MGGIGCSDHPVGGYDAQRGRVDLVILFIWLARDLFGRLDSVLLPFAFPQKMGHKEAQLQRP
jgi:hypothetical protein